MKNKIKVLFFMDGIGNAGGIQEMAIKWMENIDRNKIQIDILSYNTGKQDNYADRVRKLGGEVYIIDTYIHKDTFFKSLKQTDDFFASHKDYDILHAHSSSKALFIMWYAKKYGIKTRILHSHCTQFVVKKKYQLIIANLLKKPTLLFTTDYYACSKEAGDFLFGRSNSQNGNVTIAHNAINVNLFKPNEEKRISIRKKLGLEGTYVIGNVGRFRPQKNHEYLIDIFASIYKKDEDCVLICVGNGELEEYIKQKAEKLGIIDRIKFLGFRDDINDIMQSFDLLLMPSLFEGLPVTGVEAQAIGVNALFSDTITRDAAILPSSTYLSLNDSPDVWAEKVISMKYNRRVKNTMPYIDEQGYNIEIETKKLENFYEKSARS